MATIAFDARVISTSTGKYVEKLLEYLEKIDHKNDYLILLKPADMTKWNFSNPKFKKIACPHKEFTFAEQIGFLKQLNALKPDLVFFPMVQQPVLYKGKTVTMMQDLTTIRFRNPSKSRLVYSFKLPVYKWLNKRVAHKANHILTPTKFVRDDVVAFTGASPDKFTITYESADKINDKPEEVPSVKNQDFIMYVGQAAANKNLDRLVDAFAILKRTQPKLRLVLVGKLSEDKQLLKTYAETNQIKDVVFTDWVSEGEKRWLYEHALAYVFPSLAEGFGLPGLEAMRYNVPVVSSNATCLPEVYQDGAHYFDPEDTADMATKIEAVLTDEALRKRLVKNAQRVAAGYSWERMAQQTLDVFNDVLTR